MEYYRKRWSIIIYFSKFCFLTILLQIDDPELGMTVSLIEASWYVDANSLFSVCHLFLYAPRNLVVPMFGYDLLPQCHDAGWDIFPSCLVCLLVSCCILLLIIYFLSNTLGIFFARKKQSKTNDVALYLFGQTKSKDHYPFRVPEGNLQYQNQQTNNHSMMARNNSNSILDKQTIVQEYTISVLIVYYRINVVDYRINVVDYKINVVYYKTRLQSQFETIVSEMRLQYNFFETTGI